MVDRLRMLFDDAGGGLKTKIIGIYALLVVMTAIAWVWALVEFHKHPILLGTALLAFSFGLRHAVDADHIAAIDNVTRKLMQDGKRPLGVGFFFSLGHSSVVILTSVVIVLTTTALKDRVNIFKEAGGIVGTSISTIFLILIAVTNLIVFLAIYRAYRRARQGMPVAEEDLDLMLAQRGFIARVLRRLFAFVGKSWHMFPLGFLFGLGFDTATEIAVLGISAAEASKGVPIGSIMVFPMLFTAGMSLVDTTDGVLMLGAYGWAFQNPIRKLYYNMAVTLLSVAVALVIGGIEALGLLDSHFALKGLFWSMISSLNDHFGMLGYGIIGIFVAGWLASLALYRMRGFEKIDKLDLEM